MPVTLSVFPGHSPPLARSNRAMGQKLRSWVCKSGGNTLWTVNFLVIKSASLGLVCPIVLGIKKNYCATVKLF